MGTPTTPDRDELIADIKSAFEAMGLSERRGAARLYEELNPGSEDDKEQEAFVERFRKQVRRPTTSIETLQRYLSLIQSFEEFRKSDLHYLKPEKCIDLSDELTRELRAISKEVLAKVKSRHK